MKRFLIVCLAAALLCGCAAKEKEPDITTERSAEESSGAETNGSETAGDETTEAPALPHEDNSSLPESSEVMSKVLAKKALELCTGHTKNATADIFEKYGFEVLVQNGYDKSDNDTSHTCAYSIGKKSIIKGGTERTLVIAAVRGTNAGEWYSNVDFAPSHDSKTAYAENFLLAAQDVYDGALREILEKENEPIVLVCGHSRGAACANLLGTILNGTMSKEDVFVYTFATPATVTGYASLPDCGNIFNFINPCDIVTMVPPETMGFRRAGTDITLYGDEATALIKRASVDALGTIAGDISSYYSVKHSLSGKGESENGITVYELMRFLAGSLANGTEFSFPGRDSISAESDFAPLLAILAAVTDGGAKIMNEHMPSTYGMLIDILP